MLVLTRKQGETIRIGKDIVVTVIRMKGKAVRIGVKAPHQVSVLRGELVEQQEQQTVDESSKPSAAPAKTSTVATAAASPSRPGADAKWPAAQTHPQRPPRSEQASSQSSGVVTSSASGDALTASVAKPL